MAVKTSDSAIPISTTMKAIRKTKVGVELMDVAIPSPGEHEVLVKVAIAGYCRTDGYVAKDIIKTKKPLTLGHEFAGWVQALGSKVTKCSQGDHVAIMPIEQLKGHYHGQMLGVDIDGAFAEYVIVPDHMLYVIPNTLSFKYAAYAEPVAASLAVARVRKKKDALGIVIGTNRIAKLTHHILECTGFDKVSMVPLKDLAQLKDNSIDFVVETFVDQESFDQIIRFLRPGGTLVLKSRIQQNVSINVGLLVQKEIEIQGLYYGDFQQAIDLMINGTLSIEEYLGDVLSFEKAVEFITSTSGEEKKTFFSCQKEFLTE